MTRTKRLRNKKARATGDESISALADMGYKVERLTPYQFRVNDRLDLFPVNRRWHDVIGMVRGDYVGITPLEITRRILR